MTTVDKLEVKIASNTQISPHYICTQLEDYINNRATEIDAKEAEIKILDGVRKFAKVLIDQYFSAQGTGDMGAKIKGNNNCIYTKDPNVRTKCYTSIFGEHTVKRTAYRCKTQTKAIFPLDEKVNLPEHKYSYLLEEIVCDFTSVGPFRKGLERIAKWIGPKISVRAAEDITRRSANNYCDYSKQKPVSENPINPEDTLVVSIDGKGVPLTITERKKLPKNKGKLHGVKKEALVTACYVAPPKSRTAEHVALSLVYPSKKDSKPKEELCTLKTDDIYRSATVKGSKADALAELHAEASRRDPHKKAALAVLTDGDKALCQGTKKTFADWTMVHYILDIIHVLSYLRKAIRALHGIKSGDSATPDVDAMVYKYLVWLLKGRVGYVIGSLKSMKTKRKLRGKRAKLVDECTTYFTNHRKMMAYNIYLDWGLPIATGVIESACGQVVKDRMEGNGKRWSLDGAEAMLRLRSIDSSCDHSSYWDFRISEEKARLYPGPAKKPLKAA